MQKRKGYNMEDYSNFKLLISQREAAFLIGISYQTIRTWISKKIIIPQDIIQRLGRRTLVNKKKLEKWVDGYKANNL